MFAAQHYIFTVNIKVVRIFLAVAQFFQAHQECET